MNLAPITIMGNVTADPELTFTANGQARLAFSVATNHVWYDQNNEKQEKVSYHNVVAWRYLAEHAARSLEKGIAVVVFGRLEQRSYEDKEGNKRSAVEIVAEEVAISTKSIESLERRTRQQDGDSGNKGQQASNQRRSRPAATQAPRAMANAGMDDEPF